MHTEKPRILSLDALRGFAAMAVAVPHYFAVHHHGSPLIEAVAIVAVEVFFVLSGFVLAPQIVYCLQTDHLSRLRVFLTRRWMRTLPPYLIALLCAAILSGHLLTPTFFRFLLFVQNLASAPDAEHDLLPIAWSLSVEEWFYVVFPIFMLCVARRGERIWHAALLFLFIFLVIKLVGAFYDDDWPQTARRVVLFRLDSICFGFLLRLMLDQSTWQANRLPRLVCALLLLVSTAAIATTMAVIYSASGPSIVLVYFLCSPFFASSLIAFLYFSNDAFATRPVIARLSVFFGNISYDVYLFHIVVLTVLERLGVSYDDFLGLGYYVGATLLLSWVIRTAVEEPILAARPQYNTPSEPRSPPIQS